MKRTKQALAAVIGATLVAATLAGCSQGGTSDGPSDPTSAAESGVKDGDAPASYNDKVAGELDMVREGLGKVGDKIMQVNLNGRAFPSLTYVNDAGRVVQTSFGKPEELDNGDDSAPETDLADFASYKSAAEWPLATQAKSFDMNGCDTGERTMPTISGRVAPTGSMLYTFYCDVQDVHQQKIDDAPVVIPQDRFSEEGLTQIWDTITRLNGSKVGKISISNPSGPAGTSITVLGDFGPSTLGGECQARLYQAKVMADEWAIQCETTSPVKELFDLTAVAPATLAKAFQNPTYPPTEYTQVDISSDKGKVIVELLDTNHQASSGVYRVVLDAQGNVVVEDKSF